MVGPKRTSAAVRRRPVAKAPALARRKVSPKKENELQLKLDLDLKPKPEPENSCDCFLSRDFSGPMALALFLVPLKGAFDIR